jgi:ABC-type multidrug transport system ATPase subunit|tara:strand:+ start:2758 stop:3564 length:807 start_codon:yes stop_codon:yes gene_type:complete
MAPLCILGLYLVERARSMKRLGCDARRKSASATPLAGDGADGSGDGINAIQLRKTFVSSNGGGCGKKSENNVHVAVDDLSFSVAPGEVFCLLGPNGAGKTTTMRMLTRMMVPDRGSVVLGGCDLDVPRELREVYSFTGFCPQFDALWPLLTTREHLEVYATLKDAAAERAGELMSTLALSHAEKRYSKNLSGGMRRKLSVAISLLGAPRVVFMDEPSTGMDPASKRLLWKLLLRETAASHSAVLLSTHSMEESEALASRIGIMVKVRE